MSSLNDENSTCSICGGTVPTRNLAIHESRCSRLRRHQIELRRRPTNNVNTRDYNAIHQEEQNSFSSWCFLRGSLARIVGILLVFVYGPLWMRLLRSFGEIFLLMIRGWNDFSILRYYLRIWKPKLVMIYGQMFGQILHFGGIKAVLNAWDLLVSYLTWTTNNGRDPLSSILQHPIFWGIWDMVLLLEYYVGTMKCIGNGFRINECCSLQRRRTFIHLFLDGDRPQFQEEEWMVLSAADDDDVRFCPNAWNIATYNYLSLYHFNDIVLGYDKVQWVSQGYVEKEEIYNAIYGAMDDFVSIVESLEWKDEHRRVWFDPVQRNDVVQWNAYYTEEQEDDVETGFRYKHSNMFKKKLVGRIQCWELGFRMQTSDGNEEDSLYSWEYHPEWNRGACENDNRWRDSLRDRYPVCMAEVVKTKSTGSADGRRHTLIIGAAYDSLQCMVNEHQIWYDDSSSSWKSALHRTSGPKTSCASHEGVS